MIILHFQKLLGRYVLVAFQYGKHAGNSGQKPNGKVYFSSIELDSEPPLEVVHYNWSDLLD